MAENVSLSAADIAAMQALVASLKAPASWRDGKTIRRLPAQLYKAFWRVPLPDPQNPTAAQLAQRKAAAEAAVKAARFRMMDAAIKLQQAAQGQRRVAAHLIEQWHREEQYWARALIGANEALARGGFEAMGAANSANWQHAGPVIQKRFDELEIIAERVKSGGYGTGAASGHFPQHVGNVADAGRGAYENARVDYMAELGHDLFQRLLGAADHCVNSKGRTGCVEAAAMGWVSQDQLIEIGDCTCHNACHCTIISKKAGREDRLALNG